MREQFQALEAAKLAAMVKGQLKQVDSLTVERNGLPANKINIDTFVKRVSDPTSKIPSGMTPETPMGFAPPINEDLIQTMIPDVVPTNGQQAHNHTNIPVLHPVPENTKYSQQNTKNQFFNQDSKTLKKINVNLKNISLVLGEILATIKQK